MSLRADLFEANSLSGSVRVLNGYANVELDVKPFALEGNISFIVDLRTGSTEGDILVSTPPIKLVDLSEVVGFTANNNVMDEGDLITFTLTTQNAANNAVVYYSTRSLVSNVNALDFVGGNTGSITIVDNVGTVTLRANLDNSTIVETGEQFELEVRTGSPTGTVIANTTNSVTIADTSNAVAISAFSLSSNVTYEAGEIIFRIDTRNAIGNAAATYYYTVTGNADLYTASSGEIVVNDNTGYVNVIPEASVSSNEIRNFTLQIRTGSVSGPIIYSTANVFVYDSTVTGLQATGGNISTTGGYKIHTFENTGTFQVTNYSSIENENLLEMLLVAGGGSGGAGNPSGGGGGGGAGGLLYYGSEIDSNKAPNGGPINVKSLGSNALNGLQITIGAGGAYPAGQGSNTSISYANILLNGFRAVRGGAGGGSYLGTRDGGSGGAGQPGNPAPSYLGGRTIAPEQGNAGGDRSGVTPTFLYVAGAGGGGAGGVGEKRSVPPVSPIPNAYLQGSNGGAAVYYEISGQGQYYAGGGGGSTASPNQQVGSGGGFNLSGGRGANLTLPALGGIFGTGGGGGGDAPGGLGGSGAPGVVIIRYPQLFDPKVSYVTSVTESSNNIILGNPITFIVSTINAANGEILYYSTSGLATGNTGSFLLFGNSNSSISILPIETGNLVMQIRRNSSEGSILKESSTISINPPPPYLLAEGGTITDSGGYRIHTFSTSGNLTISGLGSSPSYNTVDYLVVAGGGGGGGSGPAANNRGAGGGGAGGLLTGNTLLSSTGTIVVSIGAGGAEGINSPVDAAVTTGSPGLSSNLSGLLSVTTVGGGGGGRGNYTGEGLPGGSGGGAGSGAAALDGASGGSGTPGQGYPGGANAQPPTNRGGGGGGAGGSGYGGFSRAPPGALPYGGGGAGISSTISGSSVTYASGGTGSGPSGGPAPAGPAGTGNGGGGGQPVPSGPGGYAGAPGIVIIRYPIA